MCNGDFVCWELPIEGVEILNKDELEKHIAVLMENEP